MSEIPVWLSVDGMDYAAELKNGPSLDRIAEIVALVASSDWIAHANPQSQLVLTALLNHTLLEVWDQLDHAVRRQIVRIFTTVAGLNSLLARINALNAAKSYGAANALCAFAAHVVKTPSLFTQLVASVPCSDTKLTHAMVTQQIVALFAGSKLFNCLCMTYSLVKHTLDTSQWDWLTHVQTYTAHMVAHTMGQASSEPHLAALLFDKFMSMDARACGDVVFCSAHFESFCLGIVPGLVAVSRTNGPKLVQSFALPYLQSRFLSNCEGAAADPGFVRDRVHDVAKLLTRILTQIGPLPDNFSLLRVAESSSSWSLSSSSVCSVLIRRVVVLCMPSTARLEHEWQLLLERWSDKLGIAHTSVPIQEAQTQLLLLCLPHLSQEFVSQASMSSTYLNGISNRLSSLSDYTRMMGIVVGEHVSRKAGDSSPLNFELEGLTELREPLETLANVQDQMVGPVPVSSVDDDGSVWTRLDAPLFHVEEPSGTPESDHDDDDTTLKSDSRIFNEFESDSDSDSDDGLVPYGMPDNDDMDSDDDPTLAKKGKLKRPVYLKDLNAYLMSDDYDKQRLAFETGQTLLLRKKALGTRELVFYGRQLAETLCGIRDQFDMDDFETLRLNLLATLVYCSCADTAPYVASLVFSADYSLQQRYGAMVALSVAACRIAGKSHVEPLTEPLVKQLPPDVHARFQPDPKQKQLTAFASGNSGLNRLRFVPESLADRTPQMDPCSAADSAMDLMTRNIQQHHMTQASAKAKSELIGGPQIVRMSHSLQKPKHPTTTGVNNLSKICAKTFFFPLMGQWESCSARFKTGGAGGYNDILAGHFLKTVAVILDAGLPSCVGRLDMCGELLDLVLGLRARAHGSTPILEGLLTCILVILEGCEPAEIVDYWARQLVELKVWLEDSWETVPDPKLRTLAAGVLYQLVEISTKWERRLVGEYASLMPN